MSASAVPCVRNCLRRICLPRGGVPLRPAPQWARALSQPAPAQEEAKPLGHPWRVVVAVCVQRLPNLARERADVEKRYEELKDQLRVERSRLSDFELEEREHMRMKRQREKRALEEAVDIESTKHSAVDQFEDLLEARELDLASFQPAPRQTPADRDGDHRSLHRSLDHMLYLLVRKPRSHHSWQMPQGELGEGESLLQTARRELAVERGLQLKVDFLSSAPFSFHCYRHQVISDLGIVGSKVFFLKAQFRGGEVQLNPEELVDHVWVTKKEMKDFVSEDYYSSISPSLTE